MTTPVRRHQVFLAANIGRMETIGMCGPVLPFSAERFRPDETEQGTMSGETTRLTLLQQREIEGQDRRPLIRAFARELGEPRTL